jgi:hypothetical protein
MSFLAVTPVLVPLATAALTTLASGRTRLQVGLSFAGAVIFLGCSLGLVALSAAGGNAEMASVAGPCPLASNSGSTVWAQSWCWSRP